MESAGRSVFGEFANQFHGGFKSTSWGFRNKYPFRQGSIAMVRWDRRQSGRSNWNQRPNLSKHDTQMAIAMLKRSKHIQAVFSCLFWTMPWNRWNWVPKTLGNIGTSAPLARQVRLWGSEPSLACSMVATSCAMIQSEIMDPYASLCCHCPASIYYSYYSCWMLVVWNIWWFSILFGW